MEVERTHNYASRGLAGTALGLGAGALGAQLLTGGLSGLLGSWGNGCGNGWNNRCNGNNAAETAMLLAALGSVNRSGDCCDNDHSINRYELGMQREITNKDMEIAYLRGRDASKTDDLETYKYVDGQLREIREALCAQAVHNQRTEDSFVLARQDIAAVESRLNSKIAMEAERRCCGDNAVVNYVNATFYPKLVADITTAATTNAQTLYNPIPDCGCCCDK